MNIIYCDNRIEKVCTNYTFARKKYGDRMAKKIHMRMDQICAVDSVETMIRYHIGRCHLLANQRKGQYAVDLEHPYRLIFRVEGEDIQIAEILEIVDYY